MRCHALPNACSRAEFLQLAALGLLAGPAACSVAFEPTRARATEAAPSSALDTATSTDAPVSIILATDLHYLEPGLLTPERLETFALLGTGSMVTQYTDEIADALADAVIATKPDVFVFPGDLVLDGEFASHRALVPKLERIKNAGIPVLIIPGNHDFRPSSPSGEYATARQFAELYAPFGRDNALACDDASLSFVWEAAPHLRLLMVDANAVEEMGVLPASTLVWVAEQLDQAERDEARVVAFSHQIMTTEDVTYNGIAIENASELLALYEQHQVVANLSGHIHTQHIRHATSGFAEVVTMSLAIAPIQYAAIEVDLAAGELTYRTEPLDVSAWAKSTGSTNPDLLDFAAYAHDYIYDTQYQTALHTLEGAGVTGADAKRLATYAAQANCAYYCGRADQVDYDQAMVDDWVAAAGVTAERYGYTLDPSTVGEQNTLNVGF